VSWFAVITTFAYKKDQWKRTINGLFSKSCCNIIKIFEDYATKGNGYGGSKLDPRKQKERKIREASKKNTYNVDCN
jgi:hypothetical protein